jgi:hypothetical protein
MRAHRRPDPSRTSQLREPRCGNEILGYHLTGSTSVTFNDTLAPYTVNSGTEITATVPTGATTGRIQVVTPSGTLTSNVNFRVLP